MVLSKIFSQAHLRVNGNNMIVLAFDTATLQGSVAWLRLENENSFNVSEFARICAPVNPGHAETLLLRVEYLLSTGGLDTSDVDLVVFGRGPGTFTGLRIGLSTVKALALSQGMPIVGVSTLEATALSSGLSGTLVPLIDARRGELFAGAYRVTTEGGTPKSEALTPESVIEPDQVSTWLKKHNVNGPIYLVGNGARRYQNVLASVGKLLPEMNAAPDACRLAMRGLEIFKTDGGDDVASVEPVYLRAPDARLPSK